jgi:murein DD-endopeptidase MepM/ murein hydrolase activator NlpD
MRRWLLAPVVALVVLLCPDGALAQSGGTEYGAPVHPTRSLRVSAFTVTPGTLAPGADATVSLRVDGPARKARMRVELVAATGSRQPPVATLQLGRRRTGIAVVRRWTLPVGLVPGAYVARLHAVDAHGGTLRRTTRAPGKQPVTLAGAAAPVVPAAVAPSGGLFPIRGAYSFGGPDARFGAARNGHVHQGQDITAAQGTPLISPLAGTVYWRAVQESGAGHYLVIRAVDGHDYVFMHLAAGSETVAKGDPVAAGQVIGAVGATGDATGPHLHFEIWPNGWYAKGAQPIDPLPQLQAWAAGR